MMRILFFLIAAFLVTCSGSHSVERPAAGNLQFTSDTNVRYAKRFAISYSDNVTAVYLFGDRMSFDTTARYFISHDTVTLRQLRHRGYVIKSPCTNIAALSSIYASMIEELGMLESITAIDNADYITNQRILERYNSGRIAEIAKAPEIDFEKTVSLQPDMLFMFGMGRDKSDSERKLEHARIPHAVTVDHLEETPLARAEWVKFFGAFLEKRHRADSIFLNVEKTYNSMKEKALSVSRKPTVFSEIKYGDVWYMPGGNSYMACLFKDAGADYIWKDDKNFGSLPLSFEQVYARAREADFWLNQPLVRSRQELLAQDRRYSEFRAYKNGNLFNNTRGMNAKGYSAYWETGMIHPERILSDMICIFQGNAGLRDDSLHYYERLK